MPQTPPQNQPVNGAEQREHRRIFKALLAHINYEGGECYGYVHNLAKYGFGITLDRDTPVTTELHIDLKAPPHGLAQLPRGLERQHASRLDLDLLACQTMQRMCRPC